MKKMENMKIKRTSKKVKPREQGITLIALVVTIIILLILAGVTLNIALSDNGLFEKAKDAVEKYKEAEENEKEQLSELGNKLGNVDTRPSTIKEAKENKYEFEETTPLPDGKGNKVVIPGKFHIAEESGETVQKGIVIEDSDGNQFVWIPVSNIDGGKNPDSSENEDNLIILDDNTKVEITLGRYTFDVTSGKKELKQAGINFEDKVDIIGENERVFQEIPEHSKNLKGFIESARENHGYYLARYEASFESGTVPTDSYGTGGEGTTSIMTNQKTAVRKSTGYSTELMKYERGTLWNFITKEDASKVSQNMYKLSEDEGANYVESDLVNSYAWDTAIVYIQEMGNINYANEKNGEGSLRNTGDTEKNVCNIYDMSDNVREWTTEYCTYVGGIGNLPCTMRGANFFYSAHFTAIRLPDYSTSGYYNLGFRPFIYLL